jgi:hypothetical protein
VTNHGDSTVFRYSSPQLTVEIRGEEEFVREQIEAMGIIERIAASIQGSVEAQPAAARGSGDVAAEAEGVAAFFDRCHPRSGKGAHFDRVLLIGYWLDRIQGMPAFAKADIVRAYEELDLDMPRHLDQVIGSIRRDHEMFEQAGRIGRYRLTEAGVSRARELGA